MNQSDQQKNNLLILLLDKIVGLYYKIFKRLAWDNVTLYEIISTTNEFTILVEEHLVDKAFSIIKGLKH